MIPLLIILTLVIGAMLFTGPMAFKTMSQKRKKIEKYEKASQTKLSAKDKVRMMR